METDAMNFSRPLAVLFLVLATVAAAQTATQQPPTARQGDFEIALAPVPGHRLEGGAHQCRRSRQSACIRSRGSRQCHGDAPSILFNRRTAGRAVAIRVVLASPLAKGGS